MRILPVSKALRAVSRRLFHESSQHSYLESSFNQLTVARDSFVRRTKTKLAYRELTVSHGHRIHARADATRYRRKAKPCTKRRKPNGCMCRVTAATWCGCLRVRWIDPRDKINSRSGLASAEIPAKTGRILTNRLARESRYSTCI